MSKENAINWILKLHENEELRNEAEAAGSFEDRLKLAGKYGFEFSREDIEYATTACRGQLDDDDLDAVAGGASDNNGKQMGTIGPAPDHHFHGLKRIVTMGGEQIGEVAVAAAL